MDLLLIFYSVLLTGLLYFEGISSFQAGQLLLSPSLPVLGDGDFSLQCTFTLSSDAEQLQSLKFRRKRTGDSDFSDILEIPPPSLAAASVTYYDASLEARTVIIRPDLSLSTSFSITFNNTMCSDIGEYKLVIAYYSGGSLNTERTAEVKVKVPGTFQGTDYGIPGITSGYIVEENTTITVPCKADVGAEPQGQLEWYYYNNGDVTGTAHSISDKASKGDLETVRGCSHSQVSTLTLPMTESLNGILIRCTLQQDKLTADGDDHRQTNIFTVTYSARRTTISQEPYYTEYSEGTEVLTLTCSSAGNPAPSYTWLLPNGTEFAGATYELQNLQINDTGNYTCMAKNGIPNENFTDTQLLQLSVVEKTTTPAPTTSPSTASATTKQPGGSTQPSTDKDDDNTTTIIIAVCVSVVVIIVIVIIIVCVCSRKNKKKEIEEPPEKPRNNQDLNFSGYRPGLTTSNDSLKNSGNNLNTSFNSFESSDSKPRNEDGLNYVDLQFDDRPRSRRPIQVYDNGNSTQYADIAMPRV